MKKLIKYMIIVFTIIIILIVILLILTKNNNDNEIGIDKEEKIDADSFEIKPEEELKKVESIELVFNIKNCIQNYIDYINDDNYDAVMKVLDKNYIKSNNITKDNIKQKSSKFLKSTFWISNVSQKELTNEQRVYFIEGKIINSNTYENIENLKFTVIIDEVNQAFAVIPEIINDENYNYNLTIEYDNENYYNEYNYRNYSEAEIFTEYFNYYKELAINKPEKAFDLLDEEYREKRFNNSLDRYKEYLVDIDINNIYPDKISINFKEDYKEYVCIDKQGRYYIFTETNPMNISIKLDTYTLMSDKIKETYDNSSNEEKVSMNVNKLLEMIKNKDYYNIYDTLDEIFKNNNFKDIEAFKQYIKQNYKDNFTYDFGMVEQYNDVYVQTINLKVENEEKQKNFIVKLLDNREFIFSFEV